MKLPHTERGDGTAVLLLHAGIADRRMWDEHLEPLAAAGHRVVAVDLPGFGEAAPELGPVAHWEDVVETMDGLEIDRAALLGSSFGAAVALRVAALHLDRVSSLLLFSGSSAPEPDPSPELLAAWEAEEEALAAGDLDGAVRATVASWVRPEAAADVGERIARMTRENYERHGGEKLEFAPDPVEQDAAPVAAIDCPVLLAAGEGDMVDFRDALSELAARIPSATPILIPGCGHLAPMEVPEEFRRLVLEHLGGPSA